MPHFLLLSQGFFLKGRWWERVRISRDWQVPLLLTYLSLSADISTCPYIGLSSAWMLDSWDPAPVHTLGDIARLKGGPSRSWKTGFYLLGYERCVHLENCPGEWARGLMQIRSKLSTNIMQIYTWFSWLLIQWEVGLISLLLRSLVAQWTGPSSTHFKPPASQVPFWLQLELPFLQSVYGTGFLPLLLSNVLPPVCKQG